MTLLLFQIWMMQLYGKPHKTAAAKATLDRAMMLYCFASGKGCFITQGHSRFALPRFVTQKLNILLAKFQQHHIYRHSASSHSSIIWQRSGVNSQKPTICQTHRFRELHSRVESGTRPGRRKPQVVAMVCIRL